MKVHEISVLGCGVIYIDNKRVFGSKPYGLFSTINWLATDEDLKKIADRCLEVIADRKTEPQTCANGCKWLTQYGECTEPSGECHIEYRTEVDEPQTDCAWGKGEE